MAILYSYPITETVKTTDQFVLSVAPSAGVGAFQTNSITFETLRDAIYTSLHDGTATYIPVYDTATHTVDSVLKQDSTSAPTSLTVSSGVTLAVTSNATVGGTLGVTGDVTIPETAATVDTDKFAVLDSGVIKYRTGTQLRSDIGAGTGTVTSTSSAQYIPKMSSSTALADSPIYIEGLYNQVLVNSTSIVHTGSTMEIVRDAIYESAPALYLENNESDSNDSFIINQQNSDVAIRFQIANVTKGTISLSGTGTAYNETSDYRLKENIVGITGAIDKVKQLNPSRFNFIGDSNTVDGFIAHEVQSVVPEAVTGTKDEVNDSGEAIYQGIDKSKLVPLLTAALQEAIARIEALENA